MALPRPVPLIGGLTLSLLVLGGLIGRSSTEDRPVHGSAHVVALTADAETQPVEDGSDVADDPAIWIHPDSPDQSLIITTDKKRGLRVYSLAGEQIQFLPDGRINNVDLRAGFRFPDGATSLVAATNRSRHGVTFYRANPHYRSGGSVPFLSPVDVVERRTRDANLKFGIRSVYGECMYQDAHGTYVFLNNETGRFEQWRVAARADGRVDVELVRAFRVETQPEGCVADDKTGALYVGEERVGIWRFDARADAPAEGTLVDRVDSGRLVADIEGLAIYRNADSSYLIASSQGNDTFAVYDLATELYAGSFSLVADEAKRIDGTSSTDGIEVTPFALPAYPRGLFVAQDHQNLNARDHELNNQNFKLVSWDKIAQALDLHRRP